MKPVRVLGVVVSESAFLEDDACQRKSVYLKKIPVIRGKKEPSCVFRRHRSLNPQMFF
jgi:hypothetical protein